MFTILRSFFFTSHPKGKVIMVKNMLKCPDLDSNPDSADQKHQSLRHVPLTARYERLIRQHGVSNKYKQCL